MKEAFNAWKSKTSLSFNVFFLLGVGVLLYNIWKTTPFWGTFSMCVILSVPTAFALASCLRAFDDMYLEGKRKRIELHHPQQTALPYQQPPTTKIAVQENIPLQRRTIKQLPQPKRQGLLGNFGRRPVKNPISQSRVNTNSQAIPRNNGTGNGISHPIDEFLGNGTDDEEMGQDIPQNGMGNPTHPTSQNIPVNQISERRQRIADFYVQFPKATYLEAEQALDIPKSTVERLKKDLNSKGANL